MPVLCPRRWFEKDPSVLASFPMYSGKTADDLRTMARVRSHGSHLFLGITGVLFNLENETVTAEMLADLKRDHTKFQPTLPTAEYTVRYPSFSSIFRISLY